MTGGGDVEHEHDGEHKSERQKYLEKAEKTRRKINSRTFAAQEIGPLPAVGDPARKAKAEQSLRIFCEQYFPHLFSRKWALFHLDLLATLENSVEKESRWSCFALPRGSGKSTICSCAAMWATFFGKRKFVVLLASTQPRAALRLRGIRAEIQSNERLAEDFPEVIFPFRSLNRSSRRAAMQRLHGRATCVEVAKESLRYPIVEYLDGSLSPTSGVTLCSTGLLSDIRGLESHSESGVKLRPDWILIDDPQSRESAKSSSQSSFRHETIMGDVSFLSGPGQKISITIPATVLYRADLIDRLLDRELSPEFHGVRIPLLQGFPPDRMDLWDTYGLLLKESQRLDQGPDKAQQFYLANREAMDSGVEATWPERLDDGDISAIEFGMKLFYRDANSFFAEMQNSPVCESDSSGTITAITQQQLRRQIHPGIKRKIVPSWCTKIVCGIDVQKTCLFYVCVGMDESFRGAIIDYGSLPDQGRNYWRFRDIRTTMAELYPDVTREETALAHGIRDAVKILMNRRWMNELGEQSNLMTSMIAIDAGYLPESVHLGISLSGFQSSCRACKGFGVGLRDVPMNERSLRRGDVRGHQWVYSQQKNLVMFDAWSWKTELFKSLQTPVGDDGSWSIYDCERGATHEMFFDHLTSELPHTINDESRSVTRWDLKPGGPDNHLLDASALAAVAGSVAGSVIPGAFAPLSSSTPMPEPPKKKKVRYIQF